MQHCPHCKSEHIIKKSFYYVQHSRSRIRRYKCHSCQKTFSKRTLSITYYQKKPTLNDPIYLLSMSGSTQRRTARLLKCSRDTVGRKILWLRLHKSNPEPVSKYDASHIQIDELETIEHTKLKPLTIPLCVSHTYKILGLSVGKIRAKGHLAEISDKKYGPREDERKRALTELFEHLKATLPVAPLTITTDANPLYGRFIKDYFPSSKHIRIVSRDHLKKKRELVYTAERKRVFDPLFALNQRCAMLRSDIRRLTRRSWCTTKKIENLRNHLELYSVYNNQNLPS